MHGTLSALPSIGYAMSVRNGSLGARQMSLPVAPASYIYSHFKHVSGVPAPEGTRGVPISKLKILDTLIDHLGQMKRKPEPGFASESAPSNERIDALIRQYENQIRTATATSAAIPYRAMPAAPSGVLVNMVA